MNTVELASLYRTSDYKEQLVIKTTLLFNTTLLLRLLRTNMFLNAFFYSLSTHKFTEIHITAYHQTFPLSLQ